MGALKKVGSLQRARWWNDPATLPALGRDRYEASVRTSRVMEDGGGAKIFHAVGVRGDKSKEAMSEI